MSNLSFKITHEEGVERKSDCIGSLFIGGLMSISEQKMKKEEVRKDNRQIKFRVSENEYLPLSELADQSGMSVNYSFTYWKTPYELFFGKGCV